MAEQLLQLQPITRGVLRPVNAAARGRLKRRARQLTWGGIAWHVVEFAIAIAAGLSAGSIALIGFGADSLIEALAGLVVVCLFTGRRVGSQTSERRAQQLIASSFFVLAAYVAVEVIRTLVARDHPRTSWVGVGLAAFTALTMPLPAAAKRRVGRQLTSSATVQESASDDALRLPVSGAARRAAPERSSCRLVVGRPRSSTSDRPGRASRGSSKLARRRLLRRLLTLRAAIPLA